MIPYLYCDGDWCRPETMPPVEQTGANGASAARLIVSGNHRGYVEALQAGEGSGLLGLPYLKHCAPLTSAAFPTFWRESCHQAYLPMRPGGTLLICFAGFAKSLNMPIPCFHSIAEKVFDGIAYFFDERKDFYTTTHQAIENAVAGLMTFAPWHAVALLGVSGGATVPLRFAGHCLITKRLCASPSICRDPHVLNLIDRKELDVFSSSRLFFASKNRMDQRHYEYLKDQLPADVFDWSIYDLSWASPSHGTLATLLQIGQLAEQLEWLAV